MTPRDVATTLRAVAALRALCLALPHLPTPAERARLRRFEVLVAAPASATADDIEALVAGCRRWWRAGEIRPLAELAERLPPDLVERDRRLGSLVLAAKRA